MEIANTPKIITFGEIMGRLTPPGFLRFSQGLPGTMEMTFGGAEANVAASLALLGREVAFVSALPANAIADACIASLKGLGVDTHSILRTDYGRLGLYFLEAGANQRPSKVVYDRAGSAIGMTGADCYNWSEIFRNVEWFHVTGITPAVSRLAAEAVIAAVKAADQAGATISCDLNFRKKLWRWDDALKPRELAEATMRKILPHVNVLIANEQDSEDVLSIRAEDTDVEAGRLQSDRYPDVARQVVEQFPNLKQVAITLRESVSATHNNWGAMLYYADGDTTFFAPEEDGVYKPYQVKSIVDRVGGGDAFGAGLIYSLITPELNSPQTAVNFAAAASCLAHSIVGDMNFCTREEIEALMRGFRSGRVQR